MVILFFLSSFLDFYKLIKNYQNIKIIYNIFLKNSTYKLVILALNLYYI